MGIFSPLFNFLYSTVLYIPDKDVEYRPEETERLPALPLGIWRNYTKRDGIGGWNTFEDPRFLRDKRTNGACRMNFAVWKSCLASFSEEMDPTAEETKICRKFHKLLTRSCPPFMFQKNEKDYQDDVWFGIQGLNGRFRTKGQNPSWLVVNNGGEILHIVNKNLKDPRDFKVGDVIVPGAVSW